VSYDSRAYDEATDFGPDPVVVLVVRGTHDVSRLVNLFCRGTVEQIQVGNQIVSQVRRDAGGRAALRLLAEHGGPDFTLPPLPGVTDRVVGLLREVVAGGQLKQIAHRDNIAPSGLTMLLKRVRDRLGLVNTEQLVALCVQRGLIDPPEVRR
jgi:DNA-binding CsgD family transcriptional regulator